MSFAVEWLAGPVFLGAVVLLMIGPVALIAVMVVALAALVALAGAVLVLPYLLVRSLRRRLAERRQSTVGTGPIGRAIAQAGRATQQSGVAVLATENPS